MSAVVASLFSLLFFLLPLFIVKLNSASILPFFCLLPFIFIQFNTHCLLCAHTHTHIRKFAKKRFVKSNYCYSTLSWVSHDAAVVAAAVDFNCRAITEQQQQQQRRQVEAYEQQQHQPLPQSSVASSQHRSLSDRIHLFYSFCSFACSAYSLSLSLHRQRECLSFCLPTSLCLCVCVFCFMRLSLLHNKFVALI